MIESDGHWTRAMKMAKARGDEHEVAMLRGSIMLLLSFSWNSDVPLSEWESLYAQMSRLHGIETDEPPLLADRRAGWRRAAELMLVR